MSISLTIQSFLHHDKACSSIVPSIWYSSRDRGAPIWVKVPFSVDSNVVTQYEENMAKSLAAMNNITSKSYQDKFISSEKWDIIKQKSDYGSGKTAKYSACVNGLSRALGVKTVSYSSFKSVRASSLLFW